MGRGYKREDGRYQGKPDQIRKRALRNKARRILEKAGLVRKGDRKDVDHRVPLDKGGSTRRSNLRVVSRGTNRSFKRTSSANMK